MSKPHIRQHHGIYWLFKTRASRHPLAGTANLMRLKDAKVFGGPGFKSPVRPLLRLG